MQAESKRADRLFSLSVFAVAAVLLVTVRWTDYFRAPLLEQGDLAANALQIHRAKSFAEIYGNYSRFQFNHPGPAFFYVYALGERVFHDALKLTPSPGNAHRLAGALLQVAFFAVGVGLLRSAVRWRGFGPLALVGAALFFGRNRETLTSIWMPDALALPFFCFLAAATVVAQGRLRHLVALTVAGGFLVHGHVVMPLFVGAIGATALMLGVRRVRSEGGVAWPGLRATLWSAGALSALFLLPFAIDLLALGAESNVATILGRAAANADDRLSLAQSAVFLFSYEFTGREHDRMLTAGGPQVWSFVQSHLLGFAFWSGLLVVPAVLAVLGRRLLRVEARGLVRTAVPVLAVALGCSLIWGMAQAWGVRHYNGAFFHGLYFFAALLALAWAAQWIEPWWRGALGVMAVAAAVGIAGYALRSRSESEVDRGLPLRAAVDVALAGESPARPRLLIFDGQGWHLAAAVALELTRREVPCYVPGWWTYLFPRTYDVARLDEGPVEPWWIAPAGEGGLLLGDGWALFRAPATLPPSGGKIDFGPRGNAVRYLVGGLTLADPAEGPRTVERQVVLRFAPQWSAADVRMTIGAQADTADDAGDRTAEIFWNDVLLGRMTVGHRRPVSQGELGSGRVAPEGVQWETITVPAAVWNASREVTLSLRFVDARPERATARPGYEAWRAWRLWQIEFASP